MSAICWDRVFIGFSNPRHCNQCSDVGCKSSLIPMNTDPYKYSWHDESIIRVLIAQFTDNTDSMCGYCTLNSKPARKGFSSWLTQPRWVAYHLTEEKCLAKERMKVVVLSKAWKRNPVVPIRELALLVMPLFRFVGVVSRDVSNLILRLLLHPPWWLDSHKHWPKL